MKTERTNKYYSQLFQDLRIKIDKLKASAQSEDVASFTSIKQDIANTVLNIEAQLILQSSNFATVGELNLSARASNCLTNMNIYYIGDLIKLNEKALIQRKNLGRTTLDEIKSKLGELGLSLNTTQEKKFDTNSNSTPILPNTQEYIKLCLPLNELKFSTRSSNVLQKFNVKFIGDLVQYTRHDLLQKKILVANQL